MLAGCASLLGDFSVGNAGGAGEDGGGDAAPIADSGQVSEGGGADSGSPDSGNADSGSAADSGSTDSGSPDSGSADSGHADSAAADTGATDSGLDTGIDQGAPWTPTVLDQAGELALWLEASSTNLVVSGGLVESWNDLSKNKNNASNPNNGPTAVSSVINGHDALNFATDGIALAISDATSIQFATDQVYITAVAQVRHGSPYFFGKYTTTGTGAGQFYSTGLLFWATGGTADSGASIIGPVADVNSLTGNEVDWDQPCFEDGKFHIVAMRRTSSDTIELTVDDQPAVTGQTGNFDVSQAGQAAYVGSVAFGSIHPVTNFDIAEILAVHSSSGVVADTDVAKLHAYLKTKYGL